MKQISRRNLTAIELSTAAGRHLPSPSPREARTGRGLGRGVSEFGVQPSSPRPSPPLVGGEGDVRSSLRGLNSTGVLRASQGERKPHSGDRDIFGTSSQPAAYRQNACPALRPRPLRNTCSRSENSYAA